MRSQAVNPSPLPPTEATHDADSTWLRGESTTLCLTAHASWGAASHEEAESQGLPHKATPVCPVLSAPPTTVQPVTWYTNTLQLHTHACMHTRMYVVCDNWQSAWETAITKSIQEHTQGRGQASQDLNTKQEETHDLYLSSMHTHTHLLPFPLHLDSLRGLRVDLWC